MKKNCWEKNEILWLVYLNRNYYVLEKEKDKIEKWVKVKSKKKHKIFLENTIKVIDDIKIIY